VIEKRSRYARTPQIEVTTASGEKRVLVDIREIPVPPEGHVHVVRPGERIDGLAHRFFTDARRYWRIADASDELDPFDVVYPGEPLDIPPDV
jgi:hypothetical protein